MFDEQLSILNDHDSTTRLSHTDSNRRIRLHLKYNDPREHFHKLLRNVQCVPTATVRGVIKEFLKLTNLEHIRPEDVSLVDITLDRRYHVPVENAHMTLNELDIEDDCTLCFEPSLTSSLAEEPSYLTIWLPNSTKRVEFKWYKSITTLGMLLEHVIQTLSLDSIERERIHLFYEFEELNLALNYDKLLKELGIGIGSVTFINVEIIPPISQSMPFTTTDTSNELLSSTDWQNSTKNPLYTDLSSSMKLELQYIDRSQNLTKNVSSRFSPTTKINDLIKEFLKLANLEYLHSEDVNLVAFSYGKHRYPISELQKYKTLKELTIEDGCTLYFEPSITSASILPWNLTIYAPDNIEKVTYQCYKSITLSTLLDDIVMLFSLQTIERKRIRLTTLCDEKLDHILNSNRRLSDLGISNNDTIKIDIVPSDFALTTNENQPVRIECSYTNGMQSLEVSHTITIEELKKEIEKIFKNYLVIDLKLFDRMHHHIDMNNPTQTLSDFGVEPGQIVYAPLQLVFSGNPVSKLNTGSDTTIRSSSLVAKEKPDEVTVDCKVSIFDSISIKASVNDTVAELLKKMETLKKNRPLAQFQMWCGSININTEQPNRLLSDFGLVAGDRINATITEKIPVKYALESSRKTSSFILDNLSRSQRVTSEPLGLVNLGNTCYMNSALQCLAHAKPLTQFFLDVLMQDVSEDDKSLVAEWNQFYTIGTVTGAYADVLRHLWLPSKPTYSYFSSSSFRPDHIKKTIGQQAPRFATYDQQDAQEFMTYLLDEIHKELKEKNNNESSTIIEELFFGKLQSTITCLECQHQVKTINPISFLSLPLNQQGRIFTIKFIAKDGGNDVLTVSVPENGQVKSIIQAFGDSRPSHYFYRTIIVMTDDGQLDLEMPLNQLSAREVMLVEQDDFLSVSPYNRHDRHLKKLTLDGCLREFCSLENLEDSWPCEQETCKKHTKATKQLQLCSLPPILIIQFKRFSHEDGLRQKIETFVDYPKDGLNLTSFLPSSDEEVIYDLFAVTNHMGSIYGGHYIAYARHEVDGKNEWYKFDDSLVYSSMYLDSDIVSKDAYLLFYSKRDKPKPTTAVTTS